MNKHIEQALTTWFLVYCAIVAAMFFEDKRWYITLLLIGGYHVLVSVVKANQIISEEVKGTKL